MFGKRFVAFKLLPSIILYRKVQRATKCLAAHGNKNSLLGALEKDPLSPHAKRAVSLAQNLHLTEFFWLSFVFVADGE